MTDPAMLDVLLLGTRESGHQSVFRSSLTVGKQNMQSTSRHSYTRKHSLLALVVFRDTRIFRKC